MAGVPGEDLAWGRGAMGTKWFSGAPFGVQSHRCAPPPGVPGAWRRRERQEGAGSEGWGPAFLSGSHLLHLCLGLIHHP